MLPALRPPQRRALQSAAKHSSAAAIRAPQRAPRSSPNRTAPRWLGLVALAPCCSANLRDSARLIQPCRLFCRKRTSCLTRYDTEPHTFLDENPANLLYKFRNVSVAYPKRIQIPPAYEC